MVLFSLGKYLEVELLTLEGIMLNEINKTEKDKYFMISIIMESEKQNKGNKTELKDS